MRQLPAVVRAIGFFRIGQVTFVTIPQMVAFRTTFDLKEGHSEFNRFMLIISNLALNEVYQYRNKGVPIIHARYCPPESVLNRESVHHTVIVPVKKVVPFENHQLIVSDCEEYILAASQRALNDIKQSMKDALNFSFSVRPLDPTIRHKLVMDELKFVTYDKVEPPTCK